MKFLVIGDTHFDIEYDGLLDAQFDAISKISKLEKFEQIIFLGDIIDKRKPDPRVLLKTKEFLSDLPCKYVHLLRGNHDTLVKSNLNDTFLSLFENRKIKVYTEPTKVSIRGVSCIFLPHYEDAKITQRFLIKNSNKRDLLFGHFGVENTDRYGDNVPLKSVKGKAILGHIHRHQRYDDGRVTILGTPYTVGYEERDKINYVGIIDVKDKNYNIEYRQVDYGPIHFIIDYDNLEINKQKLRDNKDRYCLVRVMVDSANFYADYEVRNQILSEFPEIIDLQIKYHKSFESGEQEISGDFRFDDIPKKLIQEFVSTSKTTLEYKDLMKGFEILVKE